MICRECGAKMYLDDKDYNLLEKSGIQKTTTR